MLNVERKKFLKLIDELLGPIVPALLGLALEGNSQIRGEGGGHPPTIIFQDMSHQICHISDPVFQMTAVLEKKLHGLFNNNPPPKKKEGRREG